MALTKESLAQTIATFKEADEEGKGTVSKEVLVAMLTEIDPDQWAGEATDQLLKDYKEEPQEEYNYEEFLTWLFELGAKAAKEEAKEGSAACSEAEQEVVEDAGTPHFTEALLGKKLLKGETEIDTATAFEGKSAIALYFSGHWCPPCRGFTPKLAEFYTADLAAKGLEVVFVSSDRDEAGFKEYYAEMPWLALPFAARDLKNSISAKFKVKGIPCVVILNCEDGSVITTDGRSAVMGDPTGEKFPWIPPTFQEALGENFLQGEETVGKEAIEGKVLGLYFSAHWCPPCRGFTPQLAEWYKRMKEELGDKFEIIFCSGDRDEDGMKSYYKEQCEAGGDWLCLPFDAKDNLDGLFEVSGIPTFIIVDPDGKVINKSGRSLVPAAEAGAFPWAPPAVGDLESPDDINDTLSMCLMLESCDPDLQKRILETVEPIATKHAAEDADPKMVFYAATKAGSVAGQIRGMCGVESAGQSLKKEMSAEEGPPLVRSISSDTPTIILMDIPDSGGYYVGKMARELDGSGIEQMIDDYKQKKLTRKQLSR